MSAAEARPGSGVLLGLAVAALGVGLGVGLGAVSGRVWVLGGFALAAGLGLGAAAVFLGHLGPRRPAGVAGALIAGLTLAWAAWQAGEDHHQRAAFARDLARTRAADTGLSPEAMEAAFDADPEAAEAFLAQGSEALLDAESERVVGLGGPLGRWLLRHDAGLRLVSAGPQALGLAVPWPVSGLATLAELVAACALGLRVWRSAARLASTADLDKDRD